MRDDSGSAVKPKERRVRMRDLKDRVAIVTGAGGMGGIGRAIALRLARDGAHVVLADIERPPDRLPPDEVSAGWRGIQSVAEEVRALGRRALPVVADISRAEQVERMVESAVRDLGGVDILVNNARAVGNYAAPVVELDESEWDHVMAVNARGTFLCCRAVMRWMLGARRGGVIVNISSIAGRVGQAGNSAYSASKFAIIGFTQSLALEAAPHGIRVNAVCPGAVNTGRFKIEEKLAADRAGLTYAEYQARRVAARAREIPLGRVATPDDVAAMVAFLASDEAAQITGQSFSVDGGEVMR